MRRCFLILPALLLPLACRSNRDVVERELHARERQVQELKSELYRLEAVNAALERGFRETNPGFAPPADAPIPGSAEPTALKEVTLGRGTGGIDQDRQPGDDALLVVVVPRDADGHAVKATGTLAVTAFQITSEGLKQPFGSWELTSTELRATWRAGLLSTGYQVTLPFREPPTRERMYVVARFTALSGQPYEADQTVRIRTGCALPGRAAPAPPLPVPQPAADLPSPPEGPAPKPVEGPAPRPVEVPVKPPAEVVPPLQGPALTVPAAKVSVSLLPVQPRVVTPVPEPTLVPHPGTEAPSGTQP